MQKNKNIINSLHFSDSDKDGFLGMQELLNEGETEWKEEEQEEIKAIDTNGDGKLSKEELSNYIAKEHDVYDEKRSHGI